MITPVDIDLEQEPQEDTETLEVTPGEKEADEAANSDYPHFHFEGNLDIPDKGVMQVEYEVVYRADGVTKVDLHRITGTEEPAAAKPVRTEDALDALAAAKMKENENV
jgi:hypothetical protein